jgi:transcriptional regulator with XRE-family HTH domain
MTPRKRRSGVGGAAGNAEIVSLAAHASYRPGYKRLASSHVRGARERLGMDRAEFAGYLGTLLGWTVTPEAAERWERGSTPPGDVLLACAAIAENTPGGGLPLLESVPHSFPAAALEGPWVTAYQFAHGDTQRYHADIAHVTAESDRHIRVVNHPPEPRTEGRALSFRNEIEAALFTRHLVGHWKNVSDARYFGTVHLAVLPGETVMEGYYTGFASDIEVSFGRWKWVRLDPSLPGEALAAAVLREPSAVYEFVMSRSQDDAPAMLAEIGEEP